MCTCVASVYLCVYVQSCVVCTVLHPTHHVPTAVVVSGPSRVTARAVSDSAIRVDWDALTNASPLADITSYMVEFRETSETTFRVYGHVDQPPAMITGLLPDTRYSFRVLPVARSNTSSTILGPFPSSLVRTTTQPTQPSESTLHHYRAWCCTVLKTQDCSHPLPHSLISEAPVQVVAARTTPCIFTSIVHNFSRCLAPNVSMQIPIYNSV